jgi:O-antigen/teichoic acid export membrane protein
VTFRHRLIRNAFGGLTGTGVNLVIALLLTPITVKYLGVGALGIFSLVSAMAGYAGLLDVGLGPAIVQSTAHHLAADDEAGIAALNRTVSTAFFLYVALGFIAMAGIAGAGMAASLKFQMTPAELRQFELVLAIVSFQTWLTLPCSVWNGVVGGLQDYHVLSTAGIAANLTRAVVTVLLLVSGFGLVSLAIAGFLLSLSGWTTAFWWAHRRIPGLRIRWALADRHHVKSLSNVSGAMVLWSAAGFALHRLDRIIVGLVAPVAAVGLYDLGARLVLFARSGIDTWVSTVLPAAIDAHARGARDQIRTIYLSTTRYVMLTYGAFAAPALVVGPAFLRLWLGPGFETSGTVMTLLTVATLYQTHVVVGHSIIPGVKRLRSFSGLMAAYAALLAAAQVVGGWVGGPLGVAGGTLTAVVLVETWLAPRVWRLAGVEGRDVLANAYLPALGPLVVSAAVLIVARLVVPPASWSALLIVAGAGAIAYAIAAWRYGLTTEEREVVLRRTRILVASALPA